MFSRRTFMRHKIHVYNFCTRNHSPVKRDDDFDDAAARKFQHEGRKWHTGTISHVFSDKDIVTNAMEKEHIHFDEEIVDFVGSYKS